MTGPAGGAPLDAALRAWARAHAAWAELEGSADYSRPRPGEAAELRAREDAAEALFDDAWVLARDGHRPADPAFRGWAEKVRRAARLRDELAAAQPGEPDYGGLRMGGRPPEMEEAADEADQEAERLRWEVYEAVLAGMGGAAGSEEDRMLEGTVP